MFVVARFALPESDPWLEQMTTGNRLRRSGNLPGAEKHYLAALDLARSLGENHARYGQTLNNLAGVYQDQGDYTKAEPILLQALPILEKSLGPTHREMAVSLNNLGVLYDQMGRFPDAESAFRRTVRISEGLGRTGEDQLAIALSELGGLYLGVGRLDTAESSLRRALPLSERVFGPNHPKTARITLLLANIEYARGMYSRAEARWARALSVMEEGPLPNPITAATIRMNLGELKRFERRFAESELLIGLAIAEFEKYSNGSHPLLPAALNHLALTYMEQGKAADAEPVFLRALAILKRSPDLPVARRQRAVILNNLARLREQQSELLEAADLFRRALETAEAGFGPSHPSLKIFLHDSARLLRMLHRGGEADVLDQRAQSIRAPDMSRHTVDVRDLLRLEADRPQR
jgi:tetratricopeptide (TPR) repeat protein